jgi:demethylmenaquinone methyltransferase/2-methoxy-6-polyprenyl-1,4-benzoquinol methylase
MRYYYDTIEACVVPEVVIAALRLAGFAEVVRRVELGIFSAYGAHKPAH